MSPLTRKKLVALQRFNIVITVCSLLSVAIFSPEKLIDTLLYIFIAVVGFLVLLVIAQKTIPPMILRRRAKAEKARRAPVVPQVLVRVQEPDGGVPGTEPGNEKLVFTVEPKRFFSTDKRH